MDWYKRVQCTNSHRLRRDRSRDSWAGWSLAESFCRAAALQRRRHVQVPGLVRARVFQGHGFHRLRIGGGGEPGGLADDVGQGFGFDFDGAAAGGGVFGAVGMVTWASSWASVFAAWAGERWGAMVTVRWLKLVTPLAPLAMSDRLRV
jgi:hypothetical protein